MVKRRSGFGKSSLLMRLNLSGAGDILNFMVMSSFILLSVMFLVFLCPTVTTNTSALNPPAWTSSPASIAIALDEVVEFDITPSASGSTGAASSVVKVKTTNASDYAIYLNTLSTSTAMQNVDTTEQAVISSTSSSATLASLAPNTWGYNLSSATPGTEAEYHPVPETSTLIYSSTESEEDLELSFGARLDTSLPAGQYANTMAVSAIASPLQVQGLLSINYMQDMTTNVCKETIGTNFSTTKDSNGSYIITPGSEPTKQLIDIRDGKEYWIAKLADGNCWMTQNLAYDLVKGKVLTSSDSDVDSNITLTTTTEYRAPARSSTPATTTSRSWNLGEWVLALPTQLYQPDGSYWICNIAVNQTISNDCVATYQAEKNKDIFQAGPGTWKGVKYNYVAVDPSTGAYDAHYKIGNYYTYGAATAESGKDLSVTNEIPYQFTNAPNSICPKGWRLPRGGTNVNSNSSQYGQPYDLDDSFYRLIRAYGYPASGDYMVNGSWAKTPVLHGTSQELTESPMHLVYGGIASVYSGGVSLGGVSWYLSSTLKVGTQIYGFLINGNAGVGYVSPSYHNFRTNGWSVRCLAR